MAVTDVLLDTNAYGAFKQGQPAAVEIVQRASRLALSSTALGELLAGFYALFTYDGHFHDIDGLLVGATPADLMLS